MAKISKIQQFLSQGFDASRHIPGTKTWKIKCSRCEALVINNVPTHERGCPNQVRDETRT